MTIKEGSNTMPMSMPDASRADIAQRPTEKAQFLRTKNKTELEEIIIGAAKSNNVGLLETLDQSKNIYVDFSVHDNRALRVAAEDGNIRVVQFLLKKENVDPSAYNNSPIKMSAKNGHTEIVVELVGKKTTDPSTCDNYPIRYAAMNGHLDIVKYLLSLPEDKGVDPSAEEDFAIRQAAKCGFVKVVNVLLKSPKVNPSAKDNFSVKWVCDLGRSDVLEVLLRDKRVDPSVSNNYPLRCAAKNGHIDIVRQLLVHEKVNPEALRLVSSRTRDSVIMKLLQQNDPVLDELSIPFSKRLKEEYVMDHVLGPRCFKAVQLAMLLNCGLFLPDLGEFSYLRVITLAMAFGEDIIPIGYNRLSLYDVSNILLHVY